MRFSGATTPVLRWPGYARMAEGRIWERALERSRSALAQGALQPLDTEVLPLVSLQVAGFECRRLRSRLPRHLKPAGPKPNPFRPWDRRLEVEPVGDDHVLILNKYPVQRGHLLLISREWVPQGAWLTPNDWRAVMQVDADTTGLWFFNSGPLAGASQPHRHLQLLPRSASEAFCPRQHWFENQCGSTDQNGISDDPHGDRGRRRLAGDPLRAACAVLHRERLSTGSDPALSLERLYRHLARSLELGDPEVSAAPAHPYNLLLTPQWMALIRREREHSHGFSINGLGFAGYLLLTDGSDADWLQRHGPEALLREVVPDIRASTVGCTGEDVNR
jgi:ATP adenylyltransferase